MEGTKQSFAQQLHKKLLNAWQGLPLNKKFSIVILCVLALPTMLAFYLFFENVRSEEQQNIEKTAQADLDKLQSFAYGNSRTASAVVQLVYSNPELISALNYPMGVIELLEFHKEVTTYYENISATNPYIRSLRIYADNEIMPERYPVFVDTRRVENELWFQEAKEYYVQMRVNYNEALSKEINQYIGDSLIAFYEKIPLIQDKEAVVEVSFTLANFFGDVFIEEIDGICVIESEGSIFMWEGTSLTEEEQHHYQEMIEMWGELSWNQSIEIANGSRYLLTGKPCPDLNLNYYIVNDLSEEFKILQSSQIYFILLFCALLFVFAVVFERIANVLLGRIYKTIEAMHKLELGDTVVQIENPAKDEVGQLQRYFNQMVVRMHELVEKESKRAILEKDAELKALQNQINAHFLYNVLNNIEMMAIIDENFMIADSVTALARLLRYSMKWKNQLVPLENELNYVRDYIQLFNMRFDNEIILLCDVVPDAKKAVIPKMSVQPIVENAIIHGIEHRDSDAAIQITVKLNELGIAIGIADTGTGMTAEELEKLRKSLNEDTKNEGMSGIGLNNVKERIEKRFGSQYGITVESEYEKYTKVTLTMPLILNQTER
ncbi:MAG: sensor histidine kinase [Bacillota bacterium]